MSHQQKQHSHLSPELHDDGRSLVSRLLVVSLSLLLIIYEHPEKQLCPETEITPVQVTTPPPSLLYSTHLYLYKCDVWKHTR